jgi:hypothetical protein
MEKHEGNEKIPKVDGGQEPFMRTFSSQEEAELYRLKRDVERSDMDKFHMFCRMIRIGKMLSSAKVVGK